MVTAHAASNKDHWAFNAPTRPAIPQVAKADWARNPIDHFVLNTLQDNTLAPAQEADRLTLLRRLSLDLTGLPPPVLEHRSDGFQQLLIGE